MAGSPWKEVEVLEAVKIENDSIFYDKLFLSNSRIILCLFLSKTMDLLINLAIVQTKSGTC